MKIQLKRSNTLVDSKAKAPTAEQMDFGELAVNYSDEDPSIFLKKTGGDIVKIGGSNSVGNDLQAVTDAGNTTTNGATFAGNVAVGNVSPVADSNEGGSILYGSSGGIRIFRSSTGTSAAIDCHNNGTEVWSLQTDGGAKFAGGNVKVETSGRIQTGGTPNGGEAVGTIVDPGVLSICRATGKTVFDVYKTGTIQPTITLESDGSATFAGAGNFGNRVAVTSGGFAFVAKVTGNAASRGAIMNTGEIRIGPDVNNVNTLTTRIQSDGSASFASGLANIYSNGTVRVGENPSNDGSIGADLGDTGQIRCRPSTDDAIKVYPETGVTESILLNRNGSATFAGNVSLPKANKLILGGGSKPTAAGIFFTDIANTSADRLTIETGDDTSEIHIGSLGTGKYTVFKPSGSAEFAGGDFVINDEADFGAKLDIKRIDGSTALAVMDLDGNTDIELKAGGSAEFAGSVKVKQIVANFDPAPNNNVIFSFQSNSQAKYIGNDIGFYVGTALDANSNSNLTNTSNARILTDGRAEFAGDVQAVNFNSTSDATLKHNINPIDNALELINEIVGVRYNWNKDDRPSAGVLAQDVETVLPELVANGEHKSVNYNGLVGVLVEAVKELSAEVKNLKSQIS